MLAKGLPVSGFGNTHSQSSCLGIVPSILTTPSDMGTCRALPVLVVGMRQVRLGTSKSCHFASSNSRLRAPVAEDKLTESAYTSPAGPISPLDILYGHRPSMARGNLYMAHRCGFTQRVLDGTLRSSGFQVVATMARGQAPYFDLFALASKSARNEDEMRQMAGLHFPF